MKTFTLALLALGLSQTIVAQTPNYIEVAVDEKVELKAKSVTINLTVMDVYSQREMELYDTYSEEAYYYESEEDYYYEEMLANSPKKVTKEMKEAYAERQLEKEARLAEQAAKEAAFVPYLVEDLLRLLEENDFAYMLKVNPMAMNDYYDEYDTPDTTLQVVVYSKEKYEALYALVSNEKVFTSLGEITYEEMDDHIEKMLPKLTGKANKQAGILASSMQRKLGKVIQCTNVFPNGMSASYMNQINNNLSYLNYGEESNENPFEKKQVNMLSYIYRFELLN